MGFDFIYFAIFNWKKYAYEELVQYKIKNLISFFMFYKSDFFGTVLGQTS